MGGEQCIRTTKKVKRACKRCRKRKIKCDGYCPCSSCHSTSKDCYYEGAVAPMRKPQHHGTKAHISEELNKASNACQILKSFPYFNDTGMKTSLLEIEKNLEKYEQLLQLKLDLKSFNSYRGNHSVEKILIDQEVITLGKFRTASLLHYDQIFNVYHGLYNPTPLESFDGFEWILKHLDMKNNASKCIIYYFLKYLDLSTGYYFNHLRWKASPSAFFKSEMPHLNDLSIDECAQFVIHTLGDPSEDTDHSELSPRGRFSKLLQSLAETASYFHCLCTSKSNNTFDVKFTCFGDKLLLISGSACLASSLFSEVHDRSIVRAIFSFLQAMNWQMEQHSIGRFVTLAVRVCLDLGIHRWEFYLNQNEHQADEYRKMWWTCFWWDRWYSLLTGKPFLIVEEFSICLFPRYLSDMGASDTMKPEELLHFLKEIKDDENALLLSRIILAKVTTDIFRNMAYNREFTDISLLSNDFQNTIPLLKRIMQEQTAITSVLESFVIEFNKRFKEKDFDYAVDSMRVNYTYAHVICLSITENILLRLGDKENVGERNEINSKTSEIRCQISDLCQRILRHFLDIDDPRKIYLFSGPLTSFMANVACNFVERQTQNSSYILTILCRLARIFHELQIPTTKAEAKKEKFDELFDIICFRAYLIVSICLQIYLKNSSVSGEMLISEIDGIDTVASKACSQLLTCDLKLFGPLMHVDEKSPFHRVLTKKFAKEMGSNFSESIKEHIASEVDHISPVDEKISGQKISGDFEELENFLNLDLSLDNFADLWTLNK